MKTPAVIIILLLLSGCASGPPVDLIEWDRNGVRHDYVRYFENEKIVIAGKVRVHGVISLGRERLPKDYKSDSDISYKDGSTEAVQSR